MILSLPDTILSVTVDNIQKPSRLLSLGPFMTLEEAVKFLVDNHISGCPVRSVACSGGSGSNIATNFCGMIDILDIMAFFLDIFQETHQTETATAAANEQSSVWQLMQRIGNTPSTPSSDLFLTVMKKSIDIFNKASVADVLTSPKLTLRYDQVKTSTTLQEAMQMLSPGKNHRLLVVDNSTGEVVNILTQTAVIRYINTALTTDNAVFQASRDLLNVELSSVLIDNNPTQAAIAGGSYKEPLLNNNITSIKHNELTIAAFNIIHDKRITGIAVTDADTGDLIGNISTHDFTSLIVASMRFELLAYSALDFLAMRQEHRLWAASQQNLNKINNEDEIARYSASVQRPIVPETSVISTTEVSVEGGDISLKQSTATATPVLPTHQFESVYSLTTKRNDLELPAVLAASQSDTVGYVMSSLVANHVRRVYLTSGVLLPGGTTVHKPTGVVTLSDLMSIFAGNASTLF